MRYKEKAAEKMGITLSFADNKCFLSVPKTETSFRIIKLSTYSKELLPRHKREQDKLKETVGDAWVHPDIVFTSTIGNYDCRGFTNKQLKKYLLKMNCQLSAFMD